MGENVDLTTSLKRDDVLLKRDCVDEIKSLNSVIKKFPKKLSSK
jgi:hypothetical protein